MAIVVAVAISGVLIGVSNSMANEVQMRSDIMVKEMGTDITLVNDPRSMPYSNGTLTIYLKNTGDIALDYNNIAIFIDGQYLDSLPVISGNGYAWSPARTIELQVNVTLSSGDHTVKAVMPNGVSDMMAFRI